ncbi:MAG TPA: AIR synthase-related protein [Blastocatellia bacterium]|nr:AIR synthase-related protein [Blastocatellia bacterium]
MGYSTPSERGNGFIHCHILPNFMGGAAARDSRAAAIHCLRDPTRGGVARTLNEIALASEVHIKIFEERIPVRGEVHGACEILGLDPLSM